MKKLISTLLTLCLTLGLVASSLAQYVADYDPSKNTLSLPWVKVGDEYLSNVVLSVPVGQPWKLLKVGAKLATVPASGAVYDAASSTLSIPSLTYPLTRSTRAAPASTDRALMGGVELTLANGSWALTRAGSTVTITSASNPTSGYYEISGTIVDKFVVTCAAAIPPAPPVCTNTGLSGTFGLDKNGDGEKDEIWEPGACPAIQTATTATATTDFITSGYQAEIYYDYLGEVAENVAAESRVYVMRYGVQGEWLSCAVQPVSRVDGLPVAPATPPELVVSSATLTGQPGDVLYFYITGGTPPYTVVPENPRLVSVQFDNATTEQGSLVKVTLNSTGSALDTGTTSLAIFDWMQNTTSVAVTINAATLTLYPGGTATMIEGTELFVRVLNGTPPYKVFNPVDPYLTVTQVATDMFKIKFGVLPAGTKSLDNIPLYFTDSAGASQSFTIESFTPSPVYSTEMSVSVGSHPITLYPNGGWYAFSIMGGRPPYQVVNPMEEWFEIRQDSERVFSVRMKDVIVPSNAVGELGQDFIVLIPIMDSEGHLIQITIQPYIIGGGNATYDIYK